VHAFNHHPATPSHSHVFCSLSSSRSYVPAAGSLAAYTRLLSSEDDLPEAWMPIQTEDDEVEEKKEEEEEEEEEEEVEEEDEVEDDDEVEKLRWMRWTRMRMRRRMRRNCNSNQPRSSGCSE